MRSYGAVDHHVLQQKFVSRVGRMRRGGLLAHSVEVLLLAVADLGEPDRGAQCLQNRQQATRTVMASAGANSKHCTPRISLRARERSGRGNRQELD